MFVLLQFLNKLVDVFLTLYTCFFFLARAICTDLEEGPAPLLGLLTT